ncbi:MAG: Rhamnosyl O-methyltransferase precursor, partial [bacterium]|nr:Rhamnosyl O-methyltransferase precursor [bacterium]
DERGRRELQLYSAEAFELLSREWVKVGWNQKYSYGFTWMGRPIIQMPEDLVRIQETIYRVRPDVVIETGVAHGGSLIFYASLFQAMNRGRVIGIDIEIRPQNRRAIEEHELARYITLVEGSSTAPETLGRVRELVREDERVMVILDSNHTRAHVADELRLYAPLVSVGSYLVATDGIMQELGDVPRGVPSWVDDNPAAAARQFAHDNAKFVLEKPPFLFDEAASAVQVTHWPDAYLRRIG